MYMKTLALTSLLVTALCLTSQAQTRGTTPGTQQPGTPPHQTTGTSATGTTITRGPLFSEFGQRITFYLTPLGGGFSRWNYNYFTPPVDPGDPGIGPGVGTDPGTGTGVANQTSTLLRGNAWNYSPNLGFMVSIDRWNRFKVGVDAGLAMFNVTDIRRTEGLPDDVFDVTANNQRHLLNVGGRMMFDLFRLPQVGFMPNLGIGTFWFLRDDFNEPNSNRFYGHAGLLVEFFPDNRISFFAEPRYSFYTYQAGDQIIDRNSSLNNFNLNLGLTFRLFQSDMAGR
jgi:hypothetical protein